MALRTSPIHAPGCRNFDNPVKCRPIFLTMTAQVPPSSAPAPISPALKRRLLLAGLALLPLLPLTSCSSDDPQTQRIYYDGWLHPEGSPGVGSNPFKKEFWVGSDD